MKRVICFFLVALSAFLTMGKGCDEGPKGNWDVSPKLICPGEKVKIRWGLSNATDARISPDIGNVDPTGGVKDTDPLWHDTEYKLEAMNNQVPWVQVGGKKKVNVVDPGDSWSIQAKGQDVGMPLCEWKVAVPEVDVSKNVLIDGLRSHAGFNISITHIHPTLAPTTTSVPANGITSWFDGRPVVGQWIFVPTNASDFWAFIKNQGWDLCKDYPISITVGVTCK